MIERMMERFIFASRWILAPFFIALVVALFGLLLKTIELLFEYGSHFKTATEADVILNTLSIVDLTLTGSLLVLVIFSGYENFVSKIDATDHKDWPDWMSTIDFSGLKLKLMSSIVAISGIQLLRYFMNMSAVSDREMTWGVVIHLTFVISSLLLAWTDRLAGDHA
ncbi:TIGR00645 family protein [Lichenihabitans psoromatis]|uniref:TIGR00645 family protein n=1 Tax=Lichenihabitans psoromatis TaxID=2528642 RepID=UPI0010357262|nr:TIGR00645 family protein [Lichenihabitans psoromatis]